MLARYTMYRGKRPADDPLPEGVRQDTRKHTRHPLAPSEEMVLAYLAAPSPEAWEVFRTAYLKHLETRFAQDRGPFDRLAEFATESDVYLGCSCPTKKNPDVHHCHTVLALRFMQKKYPQLSVKLPPGG